MNVLALALLAFSPQQTLRVGDGQEFGRIEDAVAVAHKGDTVLVFPKAGGYPKTAVRITVPRLTIQSATQERIVLDGEGFDYSGVGSVPRAIFQVDPDAEGVSIAGFEISGAHNASHNGAGIRNNGATLFGVVHCDIHDNDMGIMSNGVPGIDKSASRQTIVECHIHHNGSKEDPGYNHNLYLGGEEATVMLCEIDHSLTGHNLKSRAHHTRVEYCSIHDSANRELDFVEAKETEKPGSDAVLIGNVIVKDPRCEGNCGVIQFGAEKGVRNGTLFLVNNTIVTPFASAVVALSSPNGEAEFTNNVIVNKEQATPELVSCSRGATLAGVKGEANWLSPGYAVKGTRLDPARRLFGSSRSEGPPFAAGSFALPVQPKSWTPVDAWVSDVTGRKFLVKVMRRFRPDGTWESTSEKFLGAG